MMRKYILAIALMLVAAFIAAPAIGAENLSIGPQEMVVIDHSPDCVNGMFNGTVTQCCCNPENGAKIADPCNHNAEADGLIDDILAPGNN